MCAVWSLHLQYLFGVAVTYDEVFEDVFVELGHVDGKFVFKVRCS